MNRSERTTIIIRELHSWYLRHKRSLPWRDLQTEDDTERAYQVLVSEIMLQQTQVSRVKIVYRNFLEQFPHSSDLASATNADVIRAWKGMGYNNRALRLRDAACEIVQGNFSREMFYLQSLPGVGHYTAAAIRNFAFNIPTACLDTNIRRILHRAFIGPEYDDGCYQASDKDLLIIAEHILDQAIDSGLFDARNWHAALMDFGSLVCTKRNPQWDICPLTQAGAMKAAYKECGRNPNPVTKKQEPGRMVGSTFIPNRIFRGRVIDELRDASDGLEAEEIGRRICVDWQTEAHTLWLKELMTTLKKDHLIQQQGEVFVLKA